MQMLINLMLRPRVFLLDEPLVSLDVVVAEEMKQLLRSFKDGPRYHFLHAISWIWRWIYVTRLYCLAMENWKWVEKSNLDNQEFKDKIIAALREEDHESV